MSKRNHVWIIEEKERFFDEARNREAWSSWSTTIEARITRDEARADARALQIEIDKSTLKGQIKCRPKKYEATK